MKSSKELKEEYYKLKEESNQLKEELQKIEARKKEIETRITELCGCSFLGKQTIVGLLGIVRQKYNDSLYPIFQETPYGIIRIIKVDDKYIHLKRDGIGDAMKYKKDNGWRERIRNGYDVIDFQKALEIWEKHKGES
jgi:FtsZ-binding cell division protein ZapB